MTNRFSFKRPNSASSEQDEQVWADLKQSLRAQYPNPQREGCPDEAILKRLAYGTLRLGEAEVWLDHLGHCSPCFCDFERFKLEASRKRVVRVAFSAAAILLIGLSVGLWLKLGRSQQTVTDIHGGASNAGNTTVQPTPEPLAIAVLHFENPSTTRGGDDQGPQPQSLPRSRVALSIYVPSGDGPGKYEIEFLKDLSGLAPLMKLNGNATVENGVPVMRTTTDLSGLASGKYIVRFRRIGGQWRFARIVVS